MIFKMLSIGRDIFPEEDWGLSLPADDLECLRWFLLDFQEKITEKVPAKAKAAAAHHDHGVEWSYDDDDDAGKFVEHVIQNPETEF